MPDAEETNNIKVCVRCRPFNKKEKDERTTLCIDMPDPSRVVITDMAGAKKTFNVDRAYWSHKPSDKHFATQETLMTELGHELEENALLGYNACLFAYGQTGSGKTFSVLGSSDPPELRGLLPRMIEDLFGIMDKDTAKGVEFKCSVTYFEIYNEVLSDLLCPTNTKLDIRQTPTMGVYIQGLKDVPVFNKEDVQKLLDFGAKARTVGATCMNDQSSRSHCIFSVEIISKRENEAGGKSQLRSKLNLVDLAGSERQAKTQATGERLKEGSAINKSLSNLAMVINKLAEMSTRSHKGKKDDFVPFRNSKLTHCLQDSLSGNSRTCMVAALSPALSNYEETLSTLRFAASVKNIKTKAKKNEESEEALIDNLKAEVERMKKALAEGKGSADELAGVQALAEKYGEGIEEKLAAAAVLEAQRQEFLEDAGLTLQEMAASVGIAADTPQLVNVCADPSLEGCLVYFLVKGEEVTCGSAKDSKIVLSGLGMSDLMAVITNEDDTIVKIKCMNEGRVLVNGAKILPEHATDLRHGDRLILGYSFCFRVVVPSCKEGQESAAKDTHTLEKALGEVVPDQSEAYQQCRVYVEDLQSRVGATRAQHFLRGFQKAMTLVEEANVISKAVRRKDRFHFNVEVMVDTFQYQQDEPECVIRLKKYLTGIRRFKDCIVRNIIEPKRKEKGGFMDLIRGLVGKQKTVAATSADPTAVSAEPFETVGVWELESFKVRMVHIREAFEDFQAGKQRDFDKPENDPWRVVHPWQILPLIQEKATTYIDPGALMVSNARSEKEKDSIMKLLQSIPVEDLPQLEQLRGQHHQELEYVEVERKKTEDFYKTELEKGMKDIQRYQLEVEKTNREREAYEQEKHINQEERMSWDSSDRTKDARLAEQSVRIRDLERQLERQRSDASEAREQLRAALGVDPAVRGSATSMNPTAPAEVRLRHASEESAVAAHLATKLLGSLRDIKGDLRNQMAQKADASPGGPRNFYQSRSRRGATTSS